LHSKPHKMKIGVSVESLLAHRMSVVVPMAIVPLSASRPADPQTLLQALVFDLHCQGKEANTEFGLSSGLSRVPFPGTVIKCRS
jgi:hypothetical protein